MVLRLFLRQGLTRRRFTTKDTEELRKLFEQMSKTTSSPSTPPPANPDIKLTDQQRLEADLKSQFQGLSEDLSKESGEAKSAFQRMKETYQQLNEVDFKAAFKPKPREETKTQEEETKGQEGAAKQDAEKKPWAIPKVPISVNIPQPIKVYSKVAKTYVLDALRETFPTAEYKMGKEVERQQKMAAEKEMIEKFQRGEITGDDANLPDWKKGALQPVIVKKSIFQKAREKVQSSVFGSKLEETAKKVSESAQLKSAQAGISSLKEGYEDIKDGIKEDLDAADNKMLNKVRDKLSDIAGETDEAKAAKSLKVYDQDFDVFSLEDQMETLLEDVLKRYDTRDLDSLTALTEGQAQHYFKSELNVPADVTLT